MSFGPDLKLTFSRSHIIRLGFLPYVRDVIIRPELLRAAIQFWDPKVHVFHFGFSELCPSVEEFHAYLGGFDVEVPVNPFEKIEIAQTLSEKLGISKNASKSLTEGRALNIPHLINQFRGNRFALCLCLLATFLLLQPDGQASSLLVSVAAQIDDHKDVSPMVLAETLMGLDAMYDGQTNVFGGSPLFLQLWLCDKLNLLEPIPRNLVHETWGFIRRDFVVVYEREELWV
ncbi:hypothetical protein RHMOL_Rhmol03G0135700 [Rhododendron molle]|uniref:Uncharacterized protein n=1 Tax=Rhododendron molle TaxID=49168 RepID=A0ACC0PGI8_RHOML|nr:hypothetical protein RHMOL_Rhmol03G0135700 [Rhododendron molle]